MLKFYQKARELKTQRYTLHESSPVDSRSQQKRNEPCLLQKEKGKALKRERAKENKSNIQMKLRGSDSVAGREEEGGGEAKQRLFKNIAIKQKIRDMEAWRAEERIRKRIKKETIELKKCEISVHQYLVNKIKQNIEKSEQEKLMSNRQTVFDQASTLKACSKRYKTLNDEDSTRKSMEFMSIITESLSHQVHQMRPSLRKPIKRCVMQPSNLIAQDESLLAHIIKKQKQFQQKSLKIVTLRNHNSMHSHNKQVSTSMAASTEKWNPSKRRSDSRTKTLQSKSIYSYLAYECVMKADKKSTENLIKPWDSQPKDYQ